MDNQNKKTNNSVVLGQSDSLFVNSHSAFLFKKVERIVMALYMITDFFSGKEPLKWNIREISNTLIKDIMVLTKHSSTDTSKTLRDVNRQLTEVKSYLFLGHTIGLVSTMNFNILSREIDSVSNELLGELKRHPNVAESIESDFFVVQKTEDSYKGQNTIKDIKKDKRASMSFKGTVAELRKELSGKSNKLNLTPKKTNNSNSSSDRQSRILDIIKEKGQVSIRDIVYQIPGCSSKTIQRDLVKMIKDGLVSKEGERRWSLYSLRP